MSKRDDRGFTLIETLVVVVMIGVVAVAIAAVFGVIVRASPATTARADDARSLLGITTWLPNDVSAVPMVPYDPSDPAEPWRRYWNDDPGAASQCAGADPAGSTNLVTLEWFEEFRGARAVYRSSYRLVPEGDGSHIARVYCIKNQTPVISKVTSDLPPVGNLDWTLEWKIQLRGGEDYLVGLVFELEGLSSDSPGSTLRVDATSKNFNESLAAPIPTPDFVPLTPPPPPPPSPNTPPVASDVTATFQIGTPITVMLDVSDDYDDSTELVPALTMPSGPETWSSSVDPGDQRLVTIVPPATVTAGTYEIGYTVTDSGDPDTAPLTSVPARILLTLTTDPVAVPQPPVVSPISVTFQRDATIAFLANVTDPDTAVTLLDVTLAIPDPASDPRFVGWSYEIDPANDLGVIISGGPFTAGVYEIPYRVTDETGLWDESTVTITLEPVPCSASFAPIPTNPTTAARANNGQGGARLKDPVTITISRSGDCVLGLEYRPISTLFTKSFGSTSTTVQLPSTNLELWAKNATTELRLVRLDTGTFTPSTWSLTTP